MTDREYILNTLNEVTRDLQMIEMSSNILTTEAIIKSFEKTIFNLTCAVSGYYHDKEHPENNID